jgi:hypothetical protein
MCGMGVSSGAGALRQARSPPTAEATPRHHGGMNRVQSMEPAAQSGARATAAAVTVTQTYSNGSED